MSLRLKKFNIRDIKSDKVVVLIGKRETGKSFLCRDILYHHQKLPVGTVISGTEAANSFYSKLIPPLFIHEEYSAPLIDKVLKRQKMCIKQINKDIETKGRSNIDPSAFLILDDCLYDQTWVRDPNVRSLFMNGRHYKIMFMITMQFALGIPPNLRTNIDYVFILRENIISNRKRIYDHYAGMFSTFDEFCQVMDACTENYECLVINNNAKSNKIEDQVFWYKADDHADFRIGAPEFWEMHNRNYNNNDEEEDYTSQRSSRSKPIHIKKEH